MKFDFSEEAIDEMYGQYKDVLSTIQVQTKEAVGKLQERAAELKYEPVVILTQEAVEFYNNDLKNSEISAFEEWKQGDCSFTKLIESMNAGEGAAGRSKALESDIEEEIQSWKMVDAEGLSSIDTTNWNCDESDFEDIKAIVENYVGSLEDLAKQCENAIGSKKSENGIYVAIEPVTIQSVAIVAQGFKEGISKSFSDLASKFSDKARSVAKAGESASQQATARSSKHVGASISALNAKAKSIWD